jgi:hypothetical protein
MKDKTLSGVLWVVVGGLMKQPALISMPIISGSIISRITLREINNYDIGISQSLSYLLDSKENHA